MRSLQVQGEAIRERLLQKQREGILTFASPTADRNYKQVFLYASPEVRKDFCNAILRVMMPEVPLKVREIKVESEFVDREAVNRASGDGQRPQNLKVDALFHVDMEDGRRDGLLQTRSHMLMEKPAQILAEMQVREQPFGARLMSYVSKILAEVPIDVERNIIPPPVYAIAFCMWECGQLVKRCSIRSYELDAQKTNRFIEVGCSSVFLGKLIEVKNSDRNALNTKLANGQNALKEKVIGLFGKRNWESLELEEKKVYLWLEFLSFAHLMTEEQKNESLECLNGSDVDVFNEAYDVVKLKFEGVTMEDIRERYPDIYGYEEERLEKEQAEAELTQAKAELTQTKAELTQTKARLTQAEVESTVNVIIAVRNNPNLVQELIDKLPLKLREPVRKQLKDRGVDISEAAKAAYDTGVRRRQFEPPTSEKDKKRRESSQVTGSPKFTGKARPKGSRQARRSSTKPRNS